MTRPRFQTLRRLLRAFRDGWLLLGLSLALIVALELGLRGAFALKDMVAAPPMVDPRLIRDGYGGESWPVQHRRELEALSDRWEPYTYFRQRPFQGSTIHIDDQGRRAVWKPPEDGKPRLKLLVLGGSSLWGFGARDDETIPSLLARYLHDRGVAVEVRNLAEIGYVSTQEVVALARELQAGYRPDVVLFYDGVNDSASTLLEGKAGLTTNERNRAREFNLLQSPARATVAALGKLVADSALRRTAEAVARRVVGPVDPTPALPAVVPDDLARAVVDAYQANMELVDALAARYGFRTLFAWQPAVFDRASPTPFEREEAAKYAWLAPIFERVGAELEKRESLKSRSDFLDLRPLFKDSPDLIFIDYCHTTERANAQIAERLTTPVLERLSGRGKTK
ncbi:SGNH/GDSL hydrolase family protein [Paludisphaera rhizosphaerae]|uniref:SGNH/GDSL hydrolase family protein n=1 Tax=Paludisphaera rhizosphaerae TaxID=2711216 RepID=UPI0013EA47B7|nr:hypothetical protein [Paludisphaera rhizosphaerae]